MRSVITKALVALLAAVTTSLAGVKYEGHSHFSTREIDGILGVSARNAPGEAELGDRLPALLDAYLRAGYWDAVLRLHRDGDDLVVAIEEGEVVVVESRDVTGAPRTLAPTVEERVAVREGHPLDERELATDLESTTRILAEGGYPFAETSATDFVREGDGIRYRLRVSPDRTVRVDSLRIQGLDVTRSGTALKIARFDPGERYRESMLDAIRTRLSRSGMFTRVSPVELKLLPDGESGVYDVEVEEAPSTIVHGVVGVGGANQELTGLLDVALTNLFGTARAFDARWEGRGQGRAYYEVGYREPWILGWPVAFAGRFKQDQEDTVFTRTDWLADLEFALTERFAIRGGWQSEESVTPFQSIKRTDRTSTRVGLRWDDRGLLLDPRQGTILDILGTTGTQKETSQTDVVVDRQVTTLEVHSEVRTASGMNDGSFLGIQGFLREAPGEELRPENLYPIGGAGSLRGYEERQFRTGFGGVVTIEGRRYIKADGSRFALFVDIAYMDPLRSIGTDGDPWKLGAGLGFRAGTRLGLLGIDLAASEDIRSYEEMRIHLSVEGRY